jgi:hypothetical protein
MRRFDSPAAAPRGIPPPHELARAQGRMPARPRRQHRRQGPSRRSPVTRHRWCHGCVGGELLWGVRAAVRHEPERSTSSAPSTSPRPSTHTRREHSGLEEVVKHLIRRRLGRGFAEGAGGCGWEEEEVESGDEGEFGPEELMPNVLSDTLQYLEDTDIYMMNIRMVSATCCSLIGHISSSRVPGFR